jgi:hypothetical protein
MEVAVHPTMVMRDWKRTGRRGDMTAADDHHAHHVVPRPGARAALEDALRAEGVQPIGSADDLADEAVFESDDELDDFLNFTYAARRADID